MPITPTAFLDLVGTPSLVSGGTNPLILGTSGAGSLVLMTNGVARLTIDGNGATTLSSTLDFILANNDYLLAKNAAGNANINVLKVDATDDTVLNADLGDFIKFAINGVTGLTYEGGTFTYGGVSAGLAFTAATIDGTDNGSVALYGGGGSAAGRGASLTINGNESSAGGVLLSTGDASGSALTLNNSASNGTMSFNMNGAVRWTMSAAGLIANDATSGSNLSFLAVDTGILFKTSNALTATGTSISDALQLVSSVANVTTTASGTGVKLSDNIGIGGMVFVKNRGANALLIYPPNASGTIDAATGGTAVSVASTAGALFFKTAANTWISLEAGTAVG